MNLVQKGAGTGKMCLTDSLLSKQTWMPTVCLEVGPWDPWLRDPVSPCWELWGLAHGAGVLASC